MEQSTNPQGIFRSLDWITVVLYLLLLTIGWFSVVGATYNFGDPLVIDYTTRAGKQLLWIGLALVWAFVLMFVDDRIYDTFSYIFYIFMMGILLITPFISQGHKGSYSWIDIGSVSLQPAEFAKTATALALAKLMGSYGFSLFRPRNFLLALALVLIPMALIIRQRETGSALVYLAFFLVFYREGMSGSVLFVAFSAVVYFIVGLRYDADPLPHTLSSVGQFSVLVLVWVFTVLLSWIYDRNKLHALHMALGGLVLLGSAYAVSRFIVPFDIAWVALGVCLGCVAYIVVQAIRTRVPRLLLMALFGLGSLTVYYSADYALNNLLEPHQQDRVRVLIGLEEDLIKAGYNVNQSKIAIGRLLGQGIPQRNADQAQVRARAGHRLHLLHHRRGNGLHWVGRRAFPFPGHHPAAHPPGRKAALQLWPRLWLLRAEHPALPRVHQRGHGAWADAGHRHSPAVLQLRRLVAVGIHPAFVYFPAY